MLIAGSKSRPASRHFSFTAFYILQAVRCLLAIAGTLLIAASADLGTATPWLCSGAVLGTLLAGRWLKHGRSFSDVVVIHGFAALVLQGVLWISGQSVSGPQANDFLIFRVTEHIVLTFWFYAVPFTLTWFFWTKRISASIEALFMSGTFLWLLSGHRNYQIDAPKNIMHLAWDNPFGTFEPQYLLLTLGVIFTLFIGTYLALATDRPLLRDELPKRSHGKRKKLSLLVTYGGILGLFFLFASYVGKTYSDNLSRAANGVGTSEKEQGQSPLGFHSAVGKTKQPSALVRLESDFAKNPWTPMLYMREGALSQFNGRELVVANSSLDTDVPNIKIGEPYVGLRPKDESVRSEIVQSIYLLTKHKATFAIDRPVSIRLIKNPDEDRFNLAYQALSYAPIAKLNDLIGEDVGNPEWDERTRNHYLRAPGSNSSRTEDSLPLMYSAESPLQDEFGEDLRYSVLSKRLLKNSTTPVEKALAIVNHLSQNSLYTRKPGHTAAENGDPVAPYLFSEEMRGYCVHFSHAAVYLMRLAGIPARIATGYLTDLTYAKDGHILLHLGDRHAWPEIYVQGLGWTVVDITPANAENEEPIVPDEKLLEELMGKIDPAEELIAPPPLAPEDFEEEPILAKVMTRSNFLILFLSLVASFILIKLWIRHSWRLAIDPRKKILLAYSSSNALLADIGVNRRFGETRREFTDRLGRAEKINSEEITKLQESAKFKRDSLEVDASTIKDALRDVEKSVDSRFAKWLRWISLLSPLSLIRFKKW